MIQKGAVKVMKDHEHHNHDNNEKHEHRQHEHEKEKNNQKHSQHEHKNHDHSEHHEMMIKDFKKRFYISLIVTIPIILLSPMIQQWFNFQVNIPGSKYILFILSTFIFIYGGWPFLTGFKDEMKSKSPGMMTLIAMAIAVAYFYSTAVVFGLEGDYFFWELATLIVIMLLGHWIEMRSILNASNALQKLAELMPNEAHLINNGEVKEISIQELIAGDKVLIKPGEKIPADGVIEKGSSYINEAMLTGESKPVEKETGDEVIGGSINGDGSLEVTIENTGEDSYLSKVIELVRKAQEGKSNTQLLADKAAFWLTIVALTVGFVTLAGWLIAGESFTFAIARMATVMVITCPHALGLAIPLVVATSTAQSAKNGLLIRNRTAFENARKITTVVFDKTGTLTKGIFGVNEIIITEDSYSEKDTITLAAALEQNSEHPIATGILEKAKEMNINIPEIHSFEAIKGKGVQGIVNEEEVKVVSPGFLEENSIKIPDEIEESTYTTVFLLVKDQLIAAISLADEIRTESKNAISKLKKDGIKCWMLTGDNKQIAKKVSEELGLDGYFAEVLPHEKQEKIKELQGQNEFVAMTGDGVNDAPALAQADVGIAIGSGTDVAAETADIILVNSNPQDVTSLIMFGKATYKKMIQNLAWATGYNVFAIPLAAGIFINMGIIISPAVGAVLMSLSTIIVAINAKTLKVTKG
jgi:Cu2+-exporting ATPase